MSDIEMATRAELSSDLAQLYKYATAAVESVVANIESLNPRVIHAAISQLNSYGTETARVLLQTLRTARTRLDLELGFLRAVVRLQHQAATLLPPELRARCDRVTVKQDGGVPTTVDLLLENGSTTRVTWPKVVLPAAWGVASDLPRAPPRDVPGSLVAQAIAALEDASSTCEAIRTHCHLARFAAAVCANIVEPQPTVTAFFVVAARLTNLSLLDVEPQVSLRGRPPSVRQAGLKRKCYIDD